MTRAAISSRCPLLPRGALTFLAVVATVGARAQTPPAPADADPKKACLASHVEAQRSQRAGSLLRARHQLLECMRAECAELVRQDCIRLLAEVQASLAIIRFEAVGPSGEPTELARAWLDGVELALRTGEPTTLDPGRHEVRGESTQGWQATMVVDVAPGARDEPVVLRLEAPAETLVPAGAAPSALRPSAASPSGAGTTGPERTPPGAAATAGPKRADPAASPTFVEPYDPGATARGWAYGIGALGVTALGAFAVLGGLGLSVQNHLEENCAPHCSVEEVREMDRLYAAADICLATGLTAFVSAVVIYLTAAEPSEAPAASAGRAMTGGWRF